MSETKNDKDARPKIRTVEQVSAGGAAYRLENSQLEFAIISVAPSGRWQLPKGIIDAGESPEQAAQREVREEAGIETELFEKIEIIEYWYVGDYRGERVRFHKLVHFYLMKYTGGAVENHDHEVMEARWVSTENAIEMLAFAAEKKVIEKAVKILEKIRQ